MAHIELLTESFDPWQKLVEHQTQQPQLAGKYGATSVFVGTMRDFNEGDSVVGMTLEYYPGMTEKQLARLVEQALAQWQALDVLLLHRVGDIDPGEAIVLVAVWASHRGDAFDVSRAVMEALKAQAPFWKQERLSDGSQRWVEKNSNGYAA